MQPKKDFSLKLEYVSDWCLPLAQGEIGKCLSRFVPSEMGVLGCSFHILALMANYHINKEA